MNLVVFLTLISFYAKKLIVLSAITSDSDDSRG